MVTMMKRTGNIQYSDINSKKTNRLYSKSLRTWVVCILDELLKVPSKFKGLGSSSEVDLCGTESVHQLTKGNEVYRVRGWLVTLIAITGKLKQATVLLKIIDLAHDRKIEIFGKRLETFSKNRSELPLENSPFGKLRFRKNIWMGFPEFANKGWVVLNWCGISVQSERF